MSVTRRLTLVLALAGAIVLLAGSLLRYHSGTLLLLQESERIRQIMTLRLAVSLPVPLYEYNLSTIRDTVAAEFVREEIAGVLVFAGDQERILCGLQRGPDGTLQPATTPPDLPAPQLIEIPIKGPTETGSPALVGFVRIFIDPALPRQRLIRSILREQGITGLNLLLLILLAAYLSQQGIGRPLWIFRNRMHLVKENASSRTSAESWLDYSPAGDARDETQAFSELHEMGESLHAMLLALADREERLRITLNSIGDAVIAATPTGLVEHMNPVAEQLTGWKQADALGKPLTEIFRISGEGNQYPLENPVEKVLRQGIVIGAEEAMLLQSQDGTWFRISSNAAPILDSSRTIRGVVLVFRDITEEYRMAAQLRQTRKMDAIGQLAGGLAHDFNNLLAGIFGGTDLLLMRLPEGDRLRKSAQMIRDTATNASELIGKLLSFSRRTKGETKPVDLHRVIRDTVHLLQHSISKKISVILELHAQSFTLPGDAAELQSAFLNLGVNARDAIANGGTITFSTRNEPGTLVISVADTGAGLTPEVKEHLFEPFFTTKEVGKGTGLGLSATFGIVKRHNGTIHATSKPGQGAEFTIILPLELPSGEAHGAAPTAAAAAAATGPAQPTATTSSPPLAPKDGKLFLIIDDDAAIREIIGESLLHQGGQSLTAADGQTGLDLFRSHRDRIVAIILDIVMPGIDGREVFRQVRATDATLPILLVSGSIERCELAKLLDQHSLFVQKPFSIAELGNALRRLTGEPS